MSEMTPQQKRAYNRQQFKDKFQRFWIIYVALFGTGLLSSISGFLLPAQVTNGNFVFSVSTLLVGTFYAVGFLSNGEGAAYFWFDKLTDYDEDNSWQIAIAVIMLFVSVFTILMTTLAAGSFIAYWVGALTDFNVLPFWAQSWVVWSIPALWVMQITTGTAFKALSDEAAAERATKAVIRGITQNIQKDKAKARENYWRDNAPDLARQLGEREAQKEIRLYEAQLGDKQSPNQ